MPFPISRLKRHHSDVSDVSVRSEPEDLAINLCLRHGSSAERVLLVALPKQKTVEQTTHINQTLGFVRLLRS